jgi:HD-GYP domain-containing protein (c-di-GMP phosphodiesterase class II)/DNA-binding response OmpR family regulator
MGVHLNALIVEDSADDLFLILRELQRAGYNVSHRQVINERGMADALTARWDVVLSDYSLPQFSGRTALEMCKQSGLDAPFIIVSGAIGESTAVEMMRAGASDYVMKGTLARLVPAIQRELAEFQTGRERRQADRVQAAVYDISRAANTAVTLSELYQAIHASLCKIMSAEHFYIAIYDAQLEKFDYPYRVGTRPFMASASTGLPGLDEIALRSARPFFMDETTLIERIQRGEIAPLEPLPHQWLGVPFKDREEHPLGLMAVSTYQKGAQFGENDLAVLGFIADQVSMVIQRRLAEASLSESERKFAMFMTHLPIQAYIKDAQGRIVFVNQRFLESFPDTHWVGKHEDDLEEHHPLLPLLRNDPGALAGELVQKSWQVNLLDGSHYFETMQFLIPMEDQSSLLGGIAWDITDLKRAEAQTIKSAMDLSVAYDATLEGWSRALELRERETAGHSHRVVEMTLALAREMNFPELALPHIRRGALLHDIGKMGVPDRILLKEGPLDEDEWLVMRQHPIYAYQLLSRIPYLQPALDIPLYHHEWWSGGGYPKGLVGEKIPLGARIFALVDVWDALTMDRPYRPAWSESKTLDYLQEQAGTHFDPQVVETFMHYHASAGARLHQ